MGFFYSTHRNIAAEQNLKKNKNKKNPQRTGSNLAFAPHTGRGFTHMTSMLLVKIPFSEGTTFVPVEPSGLEVGKYKYFCSCESMAVVNCGF